MRVQEFPATCVWSSVAHLVEAVGQRSKALHVSKTQQAAEEAVEGGLVLPLLLELLSQLEQALPPLVQHPQLQAGPAVPPIRAFAGRGRVSSPPCLLAEATQVERSSSTHTDRFTGSGGDTAADINTEVPEEGRELHTLTQFPVSTLSQGQVARSRLKQRR